MSSGFPQSEFQIILLSYRYKLENSNFTWSKFTYDTFQKANKKGADHPPPPPKFTYDTFQKANKKGAKK